MTDEEILKLNVDEMPAEEARILGIDLLKEDIDGGKAVTKRAALIAAVLGAGIALLGVDTIPAYAVMGVDSVVLFSIFEKLQDLHRKKKQLKQFENQTYEGSYQDFIREVQRYAQLRAGIQEKKQSK